MQETYKWLKIIYIDSYKKGDKDILGSYNKRAKTIKIYKDYHRRTYRVRMTVLAHEYGHHMYYRLSFLDKRVWQLISNWKLLWLLNRFWQTTCTQNAFVREYARKNSREDFACCVGEIERQRLAGPKEFKNFAGFKINNVKTLLSKYKEDVRWLG